MKALLASSILLLSLPCFATWPDDNEDSQTQDQEQDQNQDQDQSQMQDQSQSTTSEQANSQSINVDGRSPGRSFIGGSDATASDQKVIAINGGWLTGSAGFSFNITDKEQRKWRWANELEADGLAQAAIDMRCTIKSVYKALGSKAACRDKLMPVQRPTQGNGALRDAEHDAAINELRRQILMMQEQCDDKATRAFETCVNK